MHPSAGANLVARMRRVWPCGDSWNWFPLMVIPRFGVQDGSALPQPPPKVIANFFAFDPNLTGGVRVTTADFNADGYADVAAAAGPGGGPSVSVFDGKALATGRPRTRLAAFFAFDPAFTGGVYATIGDFNGDRTADLILGAGPGGGPHVTVLNGKALTPTSTPDVLASFFAFEERFAFGVRIAAVDLNADGKADIIAWPGTGTEPNPQVFDAASLNLLDSVFAHDASLIGGFFAATV